MLGRETFVGKHRGQTFVVVFLAGLHRSWRDFGPLLFAYPLQILKVPRLSLGSFRSLHRFLMGFRSGEWLGHSRTLICFFLSHSFVALAVCVGSLSYWKTHPRPIFSASLREGGCRPKFPGTWPHSSSPQYGEVILSP